MLIERWFAVPPRPLVAALTDPAFICARSERYGEAGTLRLDHDGDEAVIVTRWQLPVRRLPVHARRYVGDGRVVQVDRWQVAAGDPVTGSVEVDAGAIPVAIRARQSLAAAGAGSCYRLDIHLKVAVPVLGAVLARELSGYLRRLVENELGFLDTWVSTSHRVS